MGSRDLLNCKSCVWGSFYILMHAGRERRSWWVTKHLLCTLVPSMALQAHRFIYSTCPLERWDGITDWTDSHLGTVRQEEVKGLIQSAFLGQQEPELGWEPASLIPPVSLHPSLLAPLARDWNAISCLFYLGAESPWPVPPLCSPVALGSQRESFVADCSCSVTKSCLSLGDPVDHSMPVIPVLHYLPEFAQTHVHWFSDAIQPSHPLLPASPALNLSQH